VAARPLPDVVRTVLVDRGGAPLHFVLAHVALALDGTPEALRWLSVALALGTIPLCFELGRRLSGWPAGVTAAAVASASTMLGIYGSFGRMYALFAFVTALAAVLFVRALHLRTRRAALVAAAAAVLLPAAHPYGLLVVAAEGCVALAVWRGRPLRPALEVAAVGLLAVPFAVASLRLADRYEADVGGRAIISAPDALRYLRHVLAAFAGGHGVLFAVFLGLGIGGLAVLARREPAFAAFTCLAVAAPVVFLLVVGTAEGADQLYARHLIFALPLWSAAIGAGVATATARLGEPGQAVAVAAVAAVAVLAPAGGARDPRDAVSGTPGRLAAPAAQVEADAAPGDVLFPYSPVYLAALPAAREGVVVTRAGADLLLRGLDDAEYPVRRVFVALQLDRVELDGEIETPEGIEAHVYPSWLLLEAEGPLADREAVLVALAEALGAARAATADDFRFAAQGLAAACNALESLGRPCPVATRR
jgi:hypothetical protein